MADMNKKYCWLNKKIPDWIKKDTWLNKEIADLNKITNDTMTNMNK